MSENKSLQVIDTVKKTRLAIYGERDEVNELMGRLMALHPSAQQFGEGAMRTIAQLAIMTGANPLPTAGEIWIWPDYSNGGKPVIDLGIAFYRRRAREVDTVIWGKEPQKMTPAEEQRYGVPLAGFVAICSGSRLSEVKELVALGVDFDKAVMMTRRDGVGVVDESELTTSKGKTRQPPKGRTWQWVAEKRAEKDFYRKQGLIHASSPDRVEGVVHEFASHFELESPTETAEDGAVDIDVVNQELFG